MRCGAKGIKIRISGRLGGAEMARVVWEKEGRVPLHTIRADIDYGQVHAHTTYGRIGVKVWIYKGDVIERKGGDALLQMDRPVAMRPHALRAPTAPIETRRGDRRDGGDNRGRNERGEEALDPRVPVDRTDERDRAPRAPGHPACRHRSNRLPPRRSRSAQSGESYRHLELGDTNSGTE